MATLWTTVRQVRLLLIAELRMKEKTKKTLLAVCGRGLGLVGAVEEFAVEELDPHHGEDEQEQHVHDQDVEHISATRDKLKNMAEEMYGTFLYDKRMPTENKVAEKGTKTVKYKLIVKIYF